MTKEQRAALDALIRWVEFVGSIELREEAHRALCALRDANDQAEATGRIVGEPEQDPVGAVTSREIRRLEQEIEELKAYARELEEWREVACEWDDWAAEIVAGVGLRPEKEQRAEIARLVALGRGAEQMALENSMLRATCVEWNAWADNLCQEEACATEDAQAEIARLVEAARKAIETRDELSKEVIEWENWSASLTVGENNNNAKREEIARLVELGRGMESCEQSRDAWRQIAESWCNWADGICSGDPPDNAEQRAEIERLVALGREHEEPVWFNYLPQEPARETVKPEPAEQALANVRDAIGKVHRGEVDTSDGQLVQEGTRSHFVQPELAGCEPAVVTSPALYRPRKWKQSDSQPPELESMLVALMGPRNAGDVDWSWDWSFEVDHLARLQLDNGVVLCRDAFFPAEALQAINSRLKELAPPNVTLHLVNQTLYASVARKGGGDACDWTVRGDLGRCVARALEWIAEREKSEPEPDYDSAYEGAPEGESEDEEEEEPGISPPLGWVEDPCHPSMGAARWRVAGNLHRGEEPHHHVTVWRDGTVIMRLPGGEVPEWLPRLKARAKQVFGEKQ